MPACEQFLYELCIGVDSFAAICRRGELFLFVHSLLGRAEHGYAQRLKSSKSLPQHRFEALSTQLPLTY